MADEGKLRRDVFLALAAVGWADGNLDQNEADAIVQLAAEEGLELEEIAEIEKATKEPIDVSTITIKTTDMSKADRLYVYACAAWIARVDGEVAPEDITALNKVAEALRLPDKPRERADRIAMEVGKRGGSSEPGFYDVPKLRKAIRAGLAMAKKMREASDD